MFHQLEIAIHQFAKRQMTWFRGMERRGFTIHWLDACLPMEDKVEKIWDILGFSGLQDFADCLHSLMPERVSLTEEEIEEYVRLTLPTGAVASTPYEVNGEVIARLYRELA